MSSDTTVSYTHLDVYKRQVRRVQKNTQYQQATPLDCHTGFLSVSPPAACQGESLKPLDNIYNMEKQET